MLIDNFSQLRKTPSTSICCKFNFIYFLEKIVEFIFNFLLFVNIFLLRIHLEMMKMNRKDAVLSAETWLQGKHFKIYITFLHSNFDREKSCFCNFYSHVKSMKKCILINLLIQSLNVNYRNTTKFFTQNNRITI